MPRRMITDRADAEVCLSAFASSVTHQLEIISHTDVMAHRRTKRVLGALSRLLPTSPILSGGLIDDLTSNNSPFQQAANATLISVQPPVEAAKPVTSCYLYLRR